MMEEIEQRWRNFELRWRSYQHSHMIRRFSSARVRNTDEKNYNFNGGLLETGYQYANRSILGHKSTANRYSRTGSRFSGQTNESGFYVYEKRGKKK
ncbi:unnamed protein product [Lupinus luteus]|uniref:Uncharacterized protein n=1 Tax=Lupinus luteus TaxID=3873 RepID=A0AAV1XPG3_LUPLU